MCSVSSGQALASRRRKAPLQVPLLFAKEELASILDELTPRAKAAGLTAPTPHDVYSFFVAECRTNLHVVLTVSPVGPRLGTWLSTFPALVQCCTVDWFSEWPADGLRAVAQQRLAQVCEQHLPP